MSEANGELGYKEVLEKYPHVPKFVTLKIDAAIRGAILTERAFERARESNAVFEDVVEDQGRLVQRRSIAGAVLRDGTHLCRVSAESEGPRNTLTRGEPYTIDVVDGKLQLVDNGEPVEEVFFATIPEYYGKKTSRGTPMHRVVHAGPPDSLNISVYGFCYFWQQKHPCHYCTRAQQTKGKTEAELEDIVETLDEALREQGKWTAFRLIAGSDPGGSSPYENEANEYVRVLSALRRSFGSKGIPARLVASAIPREQLERLAEAGATTYEPHIEVWDEKLWERICPGKAKYFGRKFWINNAIDAVKVFGRGNVCSQLVGGAELAQPYGFKTIDEAIESDLQGVEFFAQHGVTTSLTILWVQPGSVFYKEKQRPAPLEYYVRLASGMRDIRRKYNLAADFNDYRRCAIHPDTDLSRLDYPEFVN